MIKRLLALLLPVLTLAACEKNEWEPVPYIIKVSNVGLPGTETHMYSSYYNTFREYISDGIYTLSEDQHNVNVPILNGEFRIDIPVPDSSALLPIWSYFINELVTGGNKDAKLFKIWFDHFTVMADEDNIGRIMWYYPDQSAFSYALIYADSPLRVFGRQIGFLNLWVENYDLNLKKGWNRIYLNFVKNGNKEILVYTTDVIPSGWVYFPNEYYY